MATTGDATQSAKIMLGCYYSRRRIGAVRELDQTHGAHSFGGGGHEHSGVFLIFLTATVEMCEGNAGVWCEVCVLG